MRFSWMSITFKSLGSKQLKQTLSALFEQCKVDYRLDKVTNDKIEMSSILHTHTQKKKKKNIPL